MIAIMRLTHAPDSLSSRKDRIITFDLFATMRGTPARKGAACRGTLDPLTI
jgi:hypothetical protein